MLAPYVQGEWLHLRVGGGGWSLPGHVEVSITPLIINQCACGGVVTVIRLAVAVLAVLIQLCFDNRNQS